MEAENNGATSYNVTISFRDRFRDSVFFDNVVGFGVGGGAVQVVLETGESIAIPLDLINQLTHKPNVA